MKSRDGGAGTAVAALRSTLRADRGDHPPVKAGEERDVPGPRSLELASRVAGAVDKFELDLENRLVLTEAATGNFVVTPVIAAVAGAEVYAYTRDSRYGTVTQVRSQTYDLAAKLGAAHRIRLIDTLEDAPLSEVDVVTNTGFLRPIDRHLVGRLKPGCVIPLMWEPWEFRPGELDLKACTERGIKVYGTDESDARLRTPAYIGWTVLYWLLHLKISPVSGRVLVVGTPRFTESVAASLRANGYHHHVVNDYPARRPDLSDYNVLVVAEYTSERMVIGPAPRAWLPATEVRDHVVIHIAGNVELLEGTPRVPEQPRPYPRMSFTADFVDGQAVVDLHTAGLKVAEGMLEANHRGLDPRAYRSFMLAGYPALAFDDPRYW